MRRTRRLLVAGAIAAAAVAVPATSAPAQEEEYSCTSVQVVPLGGYYVDVRDEVGNLWIYEESNSIAGLQKGGAGDEACTEFDAEGKPVTPDTVIF